LEKTHNIEWMDTLRALATFGVILIHVSSPVVKMAYGGKQMDYWWVGNFIDSSIRFSVSTFLMLSGAALLSKRYTLIDFYKKRFARVLVPFLFWMVAYWIFNWYNLDAGNQPHGLKPIYHWAINIFVEKGISMHFWFIYMLLFLYIFTPFLGWWIQKRSNKTIGYVLLGWVVLNFAHMVGLIHTDFPPFVNKIYMNIRYGGYMILGYYLSKRNTSGLKYIISSAVLFIASILFTAIITYYASKRANEFQEIYYSNLSINAMIQCIAIFILIKNTRIKNKVLSWIRDIVSKYSFGIYLVHIMVIGVFYLHDFFWTMCHPLISIPAVAISTLIVSTLIVYILQKTPVLKYISGYK